MSAAVATEILTRLTQLDEERQRRVLDFVKSLASPLPQGTAPQDILKFAGAIPSEDLDEMERTIEEHFERVDPNDW